MKREILAGFLTLCMAISLAGCTKSGATASTTYTGTVSAVSEKSITLTMDSDETITIELTDSTAFVREAGGGQAPGGTPPDDARADSNSSIAGQSGDAPDGGGTAPQAPDGQAPENGAPTDNAGSMPDDKGSESLTWESISVGDTITLETGADGKADTVTLSGGRMEMPGGDMGGGSAPTSYASATSYTDDASENGKTYASTGPDENAVLVSGGDVALDQAAITRDSSESTGGDNASFYGVGAAALVTDGTLTLTGSNVDTNAAGGAGVFAYGDGIARVSDTTITTTQDTSGGVHVAGGGTLYGWNLNVTTSGQSSAAIRSDRGGGTMVLDGGSYTSNGAGSPAVYSTADITVNDAALAANGSEAVCIEGDNTVRLFDCDLTGNMADDSQNDCTWNVILYQSMSGDSEVGNSLFEMCGGSLTAKNGGMFYTTNTESTFVLSDVDLTYADQNDYFLKCTGNANQRGWGTSGANGADCSFTAVNQKMQGNVIWDSISQLDFYLMSNSTLTGAFVKDESNAGTGGDGYASLCVDSGSIWVVTGNSTLTNLSSAGKIVDENGNTVTIQSPDGTVLVQGTGSYIITVSSYDTDGDCSAATALSSWADYQVANI